MFLERGFDAAGVNDICRAAGISKSTLYVYFANKEELFEALVEEKRDAMFVAVEKTLEADGAPEDRLAEFLFRLSTIICSAEVVQAQRTIIGIAERMPELGARFYDGGANRAQKVLCDYLTARVSDGSLDIADPGHAAYQLIELASAGILRQRLFGYRPTPPSPAELRQSVDAALQVFMAAYAKRQQNNCKRI